MRAEELERLKSDLQRRRAVLVETSNRAQAEVEGLRGAERDPEFEEGAQTEHEQYTLHKLIEAQRRQTDLIDAALRRMAHGVYGVCLDCEIEIDPKRLAVLPFAMLCTDCATRRERGMGLALTPPSTL